MQRNPSRITYGLILASLISVQTVFGQETGSSADIPAPAEIQTARSGVSEEVIVRGQRMSEIDFDLDTYVRDFLGDVVGFFH